MSIQLICVNYESFDDAEKVTKHCREALTKIGLNGESNICHPNPPEWKFPSYRPSIKLKSKDQNICWLKEIPDLITCDHAISIHWDGFIVRPELWDDSWLQYDWIGAPWPLTNLPNPKWRVGSGGFFLFSKRMAQAWKYLCNETEPFDWQIGALYRDKFEAKGMKYAPIEVATKFAKECDMEDFDIPEGESFGFHGFQYGGGYREKYRQQVYS